MVIYDANFKYYFIIIKFGIFGGRKRSVTNLWAPVVSQNRFKCIVDSR